MPRRPPNAALPQPSWSVPSRPTPTRRHGSSAVVAMAAEVTSATASSGTAPATTSGGTPPTDAAEQTSPLADDVQCSKIWQQPPRCLQYPCHDAAELPDCRRPARRGGRVEQAAEKLEHDDGYRQRQGAAET
eukprot:scaffold15955_cov94-Phaeocystis_antarctica.AAC.1